MLSTPFDRIDSLKKTRYIAHGLSLLIDKLKTQHHKVLNSKELSDPKLLSTYKEMIVEVKEIAEEIRNIENSLTRIDPQQNAPNRRSDNLSGIQTATG